MDSLNLDSFPFTASFSEKVVFYFCKEKDGCWIALISASTPLLTLVIGCNMLIYRKKNQKNPALNYIQLVSAERCLPKILWSVILHNCFTIAPQNPCPWPPYFFLHDVSQLETCIRLFRYCWRVVYVFHIYLLSLLPKTSAVCVLWDRICFGFLVLLSGEPNLFYKQTLFYITKTCVLTFRPRPFIYFLIQFPLWVPLFS